MTRVLMDCRSLFNNRPEGIETAAVLPTFLIIAGVLSTRGRRGRRRRRVPDRPLPGKSRGPDRNNSRGFSMVELMVVVAILAVIAGIAVPSLIASRRAGYETSAKQKLAAIALQQTAFKTLVGKRRYGTIIELQSTTAGGSPLITPNDLTVPGWTFSDEGSPTATSFGAKVVPASGNPATYSYYISEDQTLRRCAETGPWTKTDCTGVQQ